MESPNNLSLLCAAWATEDLVRTAIRHELDPALSFVTKTFSLPALYSRIGRQCCVIDLI